MYFALTLINVAHTSRGCSREAGKLWFPVLFLFSFTFLVWLYSNLHIEFLRKIFILRNGGNRE